MVTEKPQPDYFTDNIRRRHYLPMLTKIKRNPYYTLKILPPAKLLHAFINVFLLSMIA